MKTWLQKKLCQEKTIIIIISYLRKLGSVGSAKQEINLVSAKVNFKMYDVTAWLKNNCNTHIAQYLEK